MPGGRLAGAGEFADEVAAPEGDVGADEGLDKVENLVVEEEVEGAGTAKVGGYRGFRRR